VIAVVPRGDPASFPPVPVPKNDPPPGYSEFYGWHNGNFYGLNVTDPEQLAKYRAEGRWFDKHGRELPKFKADGTVNYRGGNSLGEGHADPYQAELENRFCVIASFRVFVVPALVAIGILYLIHLSLESESKQANDLRSFCEQHYSTPDQVWSCVEHNLSLRGTPNFIIAQLYDNKLPRSAMPLTRL
jgi:hypothetical protein